MCILVIASGGLFCQEYAQFIINFFINLGLIQQCKIIYYMTLLLAIANQFGIDDVAISAQLLNQHFYIHAIEYCYCHIVICNGIASGMLMSHHCQLSISL
jgi:hypothetical protein